MKIFQKGFNYSQDGDGNRLVYHMQGCNMKCSWCSNPEGMKPEGVIIADEEWVLEAICPRHAIKGTAVDRKVCQTCSDRECITKYNTKGMYLSYEEKTPQEIIEEACSNEMMFYDGGGVTFTGGEATVQFCGLKEVLKGLKKHGINTAVETNGTHPRLLELFPYIDQLIIDCKLCDSKKHETYTGMKNEIILNNIRKAKDSHPYLHVRIPLIGDVNDGQKDRDEFISFIREIRGDNVTFEALSYHEFGKKKWEQCGFKYEMDQKAYVKDETLKEFIKSVKACGACYKST